MSPRGKGRGRPSKASKASKVTTKAAKVSKKKEKAPAAAAATAATVAAVAASKGRGRGRKRVEKKSEESQETPKLVEATPEVEAEPPLMCLERNAKVNKKDYEGYKGADDEDDDFEYLESHLPFTVNHPITLIGIKFASEIHQNPRCNELSTRTKKDKYDEEAFIYVYAGNEELAETHVDDEVPYHSMIEARFEPPVTLEPEQVYKIKLMCNVDGAYPMAVCPEEEVKAGVKFHFKVGDPKNTIKDGIIRALLFKKA